MILPDFSPRSPAARIPQPAKPATATAPKPMSVRSKHPGRDKTARPAPVATPGLFEPSAAPAIPDLPVLGIDIAKATFRACLLPNRGGRSAEADFANSPEGFHALAAWLKKHSAPRTRAALEATGHDSQALLAFLHAAGHHVSLLNPRWIKGYARSEGRGNGLGVILPLSVCQGLSVPFTRTNCRGPFNGSGRLRTCRAPSSASTVGVVALSIQRVRFVLDSTM